MKKLILAAVIAFSSVAFSACTKENVQPQKSKIATPLADADKGNLGQGDGGTLPPPHH